MDIGSLPSQSPFESSGGLAVANAPTTTSQISSLYRSVMPSSLPIQPALPGVSPSNFCPYVSYSGSGAVPTTGPVGPTLATTPRGAGRHASAAASVAVSAATQAYSSTAHPPFISDVSTMVFGGVSSSPGTTQTLNGRLPFDRTDSQYGTAYGWNDRMYVGVNPTVESSTTSPTIPPPSTDSAGLESSSVSNLQSDWDSEADLNSLLSLPEAGSESPCPVDLNERCAFQRLGEQLFNADQPAPACTESSPQGDNNLISIAGQDFFGDSPAPAPSNELFSLADTTSTPSSETVRQSVQSARRKRSKSKAKPKISKTKTMENRASNFDPDGVVNSSEGTTSSKLKIKEEDGVESNTLKENSTSCCICLDIASKQELAKVNGCTHLFCFSCIEKWADRENTCPLCKERFTKIDRVHKTPPIRKRKKNGESSAPRQKNSKRVKNRDQRADLSGATALQGLLANMESGSLPHSIAQFIFSNVTGGLMTFSSSQVGGRSSGQPSTVRAIPLHMAGAFSPPGGSQDDSSAPFPRTFAFEVSGPRRNSTSNSASALSMALGNMSGVTGSSSASSMRRRSQRQTGDTRSGSPFTGGGITFELDDEEDDGDDFAEEDYGSFLQRVRNLSSQRNAVLHRYNVQVGGGRPPRSYAVNSYDHSAGESAENALEIEDSDDDDDIVEVVTVGDEVL